MRIVLLRHGQTPSNITHALDTVVPGPGLTELGAAQAAAVPAALAAAGIEVDSVWASSARRAQETARPLAELLGVGVGVLDGLREIDAGELEMRTDEEAVRRYVENTVAWGAGDLARRLPGAQDGAEVMARLDAAVAEVAASGSGTALVVSHGAAIRLWSAMRITGVDVGTMAERWMENTGAVVFEGGPSSDGDSSGDSRADESGEVGDRPWRLLDWYGQALGGPALTPHRDEEGPVAPPFDRSLPGGASAVDR